MQRLRKLRKRSDFWPLLLIVFFGILASRTLIFQDGYFNMHDDLQMMRQLQLEKCFLDFQIPCRWVPDMGYGFGFPLFNFYPPLPYLIGQIFRLTGFAFVATAKYTFALSIVGSGVAMYYLAKEFFGRLGGVLSSVFYVWAPYHAVDVYVRGAMNEAWALAWFPLIFLASYQVIRATRRVTPWVIGLALSYAALLLTHNLMVLIFTPVMGIWVLIHLWISGRWKRLIKLFVSAIWAVGLAAFFTLPAVVENQFTQIKGQLIGYYDYTAHFVSFKQLFISRFWGYGPSVWLEDDGMSFQIGHIHWILSMGVGLVLLARVIRAHKRNKGDIRNFANAIKGDVLLLVTGCLLFVGWLSAFMAHPKSIFIWKAIPQLRYTQFPWRFLTLVIFSFSFIVGIIPALVRSKKRFFNFALAPFRLTITSVMLIAIVVAGWSYFLPENGRMGPLTDDEKFKGAAWDLQQTAGIYDYLPITAEMAPRSPMSELGEVMEGTAVVENELLGTDWGKFDINVESSEWAKVRIGIFDFPGWHVSLDQNPEDSHYIDEEEKWGRMYIDVPQGRHHVRAEFRNTPIRTVGNWVSLFSWAALVVCVVWCRNRGHWGDKKV